VQHYCAGALLPTEETFTHTRPAVIARERSLRPKQSPIRQGDGFVSLAMTGTARCHCEGAFFATEAISNPAGRWLRFVRLTKYGQDLQDKQDCFYGAAVELPLAVIAKERPLRPKQSPIRQGDGFTSYAITKYGQDLQDKQDCFYGAAVELPLAVIARERSLRPKQSPL